jgi:CheY-like chemotaxis protein
LCDDNVINQKVALRLLQQMGYKADVANNGLECLKTMERQRYDLIFMDVQMPEMDGLEATRQIRERQKASPQSTHFHSQITIVAMTANAMQGDREKCIAAGMDDYVAKPVRPEDIRLVLERWGSRAALSECSGLPDGCADKTVPLENGAPAEVSKQEPPVDMERLLDFANGDPANLRELIELYLDQTARQIVQLEAAVQARNADEVKRIAHSCSGASSTCGMSSMVPLLRELERQGAQGLQPNAPQLSNQVKTEFHCIQQFLSGYLNSNPPAQLAKT